MARYAITAEKWGSNTLITSENPSSYKVRYSRFEITFLEIAGKEILKATAFLSQKQKKMYNPLFIRESNRESLRSEFFFFFASIYFTRMAR